MRVWCCLLLGLCMMAHAKTRVEILADAAYPPYSWQEGEEVRGIYADIIREVTSAMPDYEVVLKPMPWRRGLSMVEQGPPSPFFHLTTCPIPALICGPTPSRCWMKSWW